MAFACLAGDRPLLLTVPMGLLALVWSCLISFARQFPFVLEHGRRQVPLNLVNHVEFFLIQVRVRLRNYLNTLEGDAGGRLRFES